MHACTHYKKAKHLIVQVRTTSGQDGVTGIGFTLSHETMTKQDKRDEMTAVTILDIRQRRTVISENRTK